MGGSRKSEKRVAVAPNQRPVRACRMDGNGQKEAIPPSAHSKSAPIHLSSPGMAGRIKLARRRPSKKGPLEMSRMGRGSENEEDGRDPAEPEHGAEPLAETTATESEESSEDRNPDSGEPSGVQGVRRSVDEDDPEFNPEESDHGGNDSATGGEDPLSNYQEGSSRSEISWRFLQGSEKNPVIDEKIKKIFGLVCWKKTGKRSRTANPAASTLNLWVSLDKMTEAERKEYSRKISLQNVLKSLVRKAKDEDREFEEVLDEKIEKMEACHARKAEREAANVPAVARNPTKRQKKSEPDQEYSKILETYVSGKFKRTAAPKKRTSDSTSLIAPTGHDPKRKKKVSPAATATSADSAAPPPASDTASDETLDSEAATSRNLSSASLPGDDAAPPRTLSSASSTASTVAQPNSGRQQIVNPMGTVTANLHKTDYIVFDAMRTLFEKPNLFAGCSRANEKKLWDGVHLKTYNSLEVAHQEGEPVTHLIIVVHGELQLLKGEKEVGKIGLHDTYGGIAIKERKDSVVTAYARTPCTVLLLEGDVCRHDMVTERLTLTNGYRLEVLHRCQTFDIFQEAYLMSMAEEMSIKVFRPTETVVINGMIFIIIQEQLGLLGLEHGTAGVVGQFGVFGDTDPQDELTSTRGILMKSVLVCGCLPRASVMAAVSRTQVDWIPDNMTNRTTLTAIPSEVDVMGPDGNDLQDVVELDAERDDQSSDSYSADEDMSTRVSIGDSVAEREDVVYNSDTDEKDEGRTTGSLQVIKQATFRVDGTSKTQDPAPTAPMDHDRQHGIEMAVIAHGSEPVASTLGADVAVAEKITNEAESLSPSIFPLIPHTEDLLGNATTTKWDHGEATVSYPYFSVMDAELAGYFSPSLPFSDVVPPRTEQEMSVASFGTKVLPEDVSGNGNQSQVETNEGLEKENPEDISAAESSEDEN